MFSESIICSNSAVGSSCQEEIEKRWKHLRICGATFGVHDLSVHVRFKVVLGQFECVWILKPTKNHDFIAIQELMQSIANQKEEEPGLENPWVEHHRPRPSHSKLLLQNANLGNLSLSFPATQIFKSHL